MKFIAEESLTTDPRLLEEQARKYLSLTAYNYVAGGAGEKATMDSNRLAFRQWNLIPRFLQPVKERDLSIELFGVKYESPIIMAPVGVQSIFHEDKETGLSEVCAEIGVPYILSTASTSSIEEVANSSGPNGQRWYQLYWPTDDEITISLLNRAKHNGYKVLIVTLDTWMLAWRPADLDSGYIPFLKGTGNRIGFTDPVFKKKYEKKTGLKIRDDLTAASQEWLGTIFSGPIVLKGIQHVEDAKLAVKAGVQGIVVSNHGGRQLDGAIGSLEVLPEIVAAVGDQLAVLFDSGIRTGSDVLKALALGAQGVLVARPIVYGLGIGGKEGAKATFQGLLADIDRSMAVVGVTNVKQCDRSILRRVRYGGDPKASL
ncbi:putative FMN dependent dehydrogenase [Xylogone sp. PMI_703]|nr:putative FMN dependent dehydrogenase [Xylogone sp. PMI_703]